MDNNLIKLEPYNAYSPIQKEPLFTRAKDQSSKWAVQLQKYDKDNLPFWEEVGTVGRDYLLVPNSEVNELSIEITEKSELDWTPKAEFFDGRRYQKTYVNEQVTKEVKVGDNIGVGIAFRNSYDGSTSLSVQLFGMRLICANGMFSREMFSSFNFRHDKNMVGFHDEVMSAIDFIHNCDIPLENLAEGLRNMVQVPFDVSTLHDIRTKPLLNPTKKYPLGVPNKFTTLPVTTFGKCVDKFLDDYDAEAFAQGHTSLWDFYNAGTSVLTHEKKITNAHFTQNYEITDSLLKYASDYVTAK